MRKAIEIAKMLQKSSNSTTEEDLIKWAEEIIDKCAYVGWSCVVNQKCADDVEEAIEKVKEQLK